MQNCPSVKACSGSERFDANPADLSSMPFGILLFQLSIALPIIRQSTPSPRKCAATDNPKGPAPTTVTSLSVDNPRPLVRPSPAEGPKLPLLRTCSSTTGYKVALLFWSSDQAAACFRFVASVPSTRLARDSFASMRRSGLSLPIAIHFMACSALARRDLCPAEPARKS